jgi:ketosteroid isomerase-like protein
MKKLLLILPLVILLCFAFGCQIAEEFAEEPAVDIAAEEEALRETCEAWLQIGPEHDLDSIMSYLADDVISVGATMQDKEGMRKFYSDFFSTGGYWTNPSIVRVKVSKSGDLGYTTISFEKVEIVDGETTTTKGGINCIWGKQADGTWKVVAF